VKWLGRRLEGGGVKEIGKDRKGVSERRLNFGLAAEK